MKIKNKKLIWVIFLVCLGALFLINVYFKPKSVIIYNIGYEKDAAQYARHTDENNNFIEWWYFDGHINETLSFVLTFWVSSKDNWVELTVYDSGKDRNQVYRDDFIKNNIEISYKKCNIKMGNNSVSEKNGIYTIVFNNQNCKFQFELIPLIRGFGNRIPHPLENFSYWFWVVAVPRGKINGILEYDGDKIEFNGTGYHDHNYFPRSKFVPFGWYWGRFFTNNYTVIMSEAIGLRKNGKPFFCIFKNGNLIKTTTKHYLFSDEVYKKIDNNQIPAEVDVSFDQGSMRIFNKNISRNTQW
jgi:hypothetical protein